MSIEFIVTVLWFFFFFNDTATTEIYTLSLHDALPICWRDHGVPNEISTPVERARRAGPSASLVGRGDALSPRRTPRRRLRDRKSTRLNSSHANISYAVFCLKK